MRNTSRKAATSAGAHQAVGLGHLGAEAEDGDGEGDAALGRRAGARRRASRLSPRATRAAIASVMRVQIDMAAETSSAGRGRRTRRPIATASPGRRRVGRVAPASAGSPPCRLDWHRGAGGGAADGAGTSGSTGAAPSPTSSRAIPEGRLHRAKLLSENPERYADAALHGIRGFLGLGGGRADPGGAGGERQDGDDGRDQRAARAQGRAGGAGDDAGARASSSGSPTRTGRGCSTGRSCCRRCSTPG